MTVIRHGSEPFATVVLHGGPGAPGSAAPLARQLARTRGVLEPIQSADSVDGQLEELHGQLAAFARRPVALIGWSWGAWLALLYAARRPSDVQRVVLVASAVFDGRASAAIRVTQLARLDAAVRAELADVHISLACAKDPAARDAMLARIALLVRKAEVFDPLPVDPLDPPVPPAQADLHEKVWMEAAQRRDSGALLEACRTLCRPVVALHGEFDPRPAAAVRDPLARVVRDFRFVLISRCGHYPWLERQAKDAFDAALMAALDDAPAAR